MLHFVLGIYDRSLVSKSKYSLLYIRLNMSTSITYYVFSFLFNFYPCIKQTVIKLIDDIFLSFHTTKNHSSKLMKEQQIIITKKKQIIIIPLVKLK